MELSWTNFLKSANKKIRKPLAYSLVLGAPLFSLTPWPYAPEATLVALGLILLPAFFEIHDKITESSSTFSFENFQAVSRNLHNEIEKLSEISNTLEIRYLSLAAYNWPHIEFSLTHIIKAQKVPKLNVQILMVDPLWEGINACNSDWKDIALGTIGSVNNFKAVNRIAIEKKGWTIEIRHYRSMLQFWGVLLNDSMLFLSSAYWDGDRLRGGHNPVDVITLTDNRFGRIRIAEFSGWFRYFGHNSKPGLESILSLHKTLSMKYLT